MNYVQLIVLSTAVIAAWDFGRRYVAAIRASQSLDQRLSSLENAPDTDLEELRGEVSALGTRITNSEANMRGLKNQVEGLRARPARPGGGIPRIGA